MQMNYHLYELVPPTNEAAGELVFSQVAVCYSASGGGGGHWDMGTHLSITWHLGTYTLTLHNWHLVVMSEYMDLPPPRYYVTHIWWSSLDTCSNLFTWESASLTDTDI